MNQNERHLEIIGGKGMKDLVAVTPEEYLRQAREIFEEREREYQLREMDLIKKQETLNRKLEEMAADRKSLDKRLYDLKEVQTRMQELEKNMKEREQDLVKKEAAFSTEKANLLEKEKELTVRENEVSMKYNLALERTRNEEMKLKRIREEFEYKLSLLDSGQIKELLENEKKFEIYEECDEPQQCVEECINGEEIEKEECTKVIEELTATVLKKYMEKNENILRELCIKHSEKGEILCAKGNSVEYYSMEYSFIFTNPICMEVSTERKYSSRLRKRLKEFNQKYPEIQFSYDTAEKRAIAECFFDNTLTPQEVVKKINYVTEFFSPANGQNQSVKRGK